MTEKNFSFFFIYKNVAEELKWKKAHNEKGKKNSLI